MDLQDVAFAVMIASYVALLVFFLVWTRPKPATRDNHRRPDEGEHVQTCHGVKHCSGDSLEASGEESPGGEAEDHEAADPCGDEEPRRREVLYLFLPRCSHPHCVRDEHGRDDLGDGPATLWTEIHIESFSVGSTPTPAASDWDESEPTEKATTSPSAVSAASGPAEGEPRQLVDVMEDVLDVQLHILRGSRPWPPEWHKFAAGPVPNINPFAGYPPTGTPQC